MTDVAAAVTTHCFASMARDFGSRIDTGAVVTDASVMWSMPVFPACA